MAMCFYCKTEAARLRSGWRLMFGGFAQLCDVCASTYQDGSFCDMYHIGDTGWRNCDRCEKNLHCGCIMSIHLYILLDNGDVRCLECIRELAAEQFAMACQNSDDSPATGPSAGVVSMPPGIYQGQGENQTKTTHASHGETDVCVLPAPDGQVPPPALMLLDGEQFTDPHIFSPQLHGDVPEEVLSDRDCLNEITEEKTREHFIISNCRKLFDHFLTRVDVDHKKGHLAIYKKHAEEHFPRVLKSKEVPISVQDIRGNDWEFKLCFRPNKRSKYVLDGVNDCKLSMQWQVGDIVTFYNKEPQGNFIIGLTKFQDIPKVKTRSHKAA